MFTFQSCQEVDTRMYTGCRLSKEAQVCGQHGRWDPGGKPVICESKESPKLTSCFLLSFSIDAVIPGQCQLHLPVSHSKQLKCSGVLEPAISLMEHQGLLIACSICSMEEGSSIIGVLNPSPAPVAVYSNQKVGVLQPFDRCGRSLRP